MKRILVGTDGTDPAIASLSWATVLAERTGQDLDHRGLPPRSGSDTAAEDAGAGLIVVGTSRISKAFGMRLGRVPLQLLHHARMPVVLVPPTPEGRVE